MAWVGEKERCEGEGERNGTRERERNGGAVESVCLRISARLSLCAHMSQWERVSE